MEIRSGSNSNSPTRKSPRRKKLNIVYKEAIGRRIGLNPAQKNLKFALKGLDKITAYKSKK